MLEIFCTVYTDRSFLGKLRYAESAKPKSRELQICAKSDPASAARNPAPGRYRLKQIINVRERETQFPGEDPVGRYGKYLFVFESTYAATPQIVVHGGDLAADGRYLMTECGLRLDNAGLLDLSAAIHRHPIDSVILNLVEEKIGIFRSFFRSRISQEPVYYELAEDNSLDDSQFLWNYLLLEQFEHIDDMVIGGGGTFGGGGASGSFEAVPGEAPPTENSDLPIATLAGDEELLQSLAASEAATVAETVADNTTADSVETIAGDETLLNYFAESAKQHESSTETRSDDPIIVDPFASDEASTRVSESVTTPDESWSPTPDSSSASTESVSSFGGTAY